MSLSSFYPHCSGNGHDLRRNAAGEWACDACGYVVGADECPPAGENEAKQSLAAPSASGQQAGTPSYPGDCRLVLAKGAGPGIWGCWARICGGQRYFHAPSWRYAR
jgi:hypothetical protein